MSELVVVMLACLLGWFFLLGYMFSLDMRLRKLQQFWQQQEQSEQQP